MDHAQQTLLFILIITSLSAILLIVTTISLCRALSIRKEQLLLCYRFIDKEGMTTKFLEHATAERHTTEISKTVSQLTVADSEFGGRSSHGLY